MIIGRYRLSFNVDFEKCKYSCRETIELDFAAEKLELDAVGLEIRSVSADGRSIPYSYNREAGKLTVNAGGVRKLTIDFEGKAGEGALHGFYKARYGHGYFLVTQLEPNGARSVFPCMDEPEKKATFKLDVTVPKGLQVISNTPGTADEVEDGIRFRFEETPPMSTYLFFLGIGKFSETRSEGRPEIIVACSEEQKGKEAFALAEGRASLSFFEDFFGIRYVLKKLHLVGVPEYAVGAMENWGSITFRESLLLVNENTSLNERKSASLVIAHEIAHQWFGDLVTMKWWSDLWLNESFATYMASVAVSQLHSEWDIWSEFLLSETDGALLGDSLSSTHPIEVPVKKPEEIEEIFDEISYGKGASVLRMIANYISERSFRKGVQRYLEEHKYGNAEGRDLWNALEVESGVPVRHLMERWISQSGYPVLIVERNGDELLLSQKRFTLSPSDEDTLWPIPVVSRQGERKEQFLMEGREMKMKFGELAIMNAGQSGFYRVLYKEPLYTEIIKNVAHFNNMERWGILTDAFSFMLAGMISLEDYLRAAEALKRDENYLVASLLIRQLALLTEMNLKGRTEEMLKEVCHFHLSRIGHSRKSGENENDTSLRERIYNNLVLYDDEFARQCAEKFSEWDRAEPELKFAIACGYARTAGEKALPVIMEKLKHADGESLKVRLSLALMSFKQSKITEEVLARLFSGDFNLGTIAYMVNYASSVRESKATVWKWFVDHGEELFRAYSGTGVNSFLVETLISRAGMHDPVSVEKYAASRSFPAAERAKEKGLELLRCYQRLMRTYS
jgi:tricorn protease interacting factor F2/3